MRAQYADLEALEWIRGAVGLSAHVIDEDERRIVAGDAGGQVQFLRLEDGLTVSASL